MADGWNEPGVRYRVHDRIDGPPEIDAMSNSDLQSIASSARMMATSQSDDQYSIYGISSIIKDTMKGATSDDSAAYRDTTVVVASGIKAPAMTGAPSPGYSCGKSVNLSNCKCVNV